MILIASGWRYCCATRRTSFSSRRGSVQSRRSGKVRTIIGTRSVNGVARCGGIEGALGFRVVASEEKNAYELLGVAPAASDADIEHAYRRRVVSSPPVGVL